MSDKPSGYGTMLIGDQERPFHVGTNQGEIFCSLPHRRDEEGQKLSLKAFAEMFTPARLREGQFTGGDLRDFIFSALVSGYEVDGLRVDFGHTKVGYWIDDADPQEVGKPVKEMLDQLVIKIQRQVERAKNDPAPLKATAGSKPKKRHSPGQE